MKLICKSVRYGSLTDEDMFFTWIQKIPSIVKFDGWRNELYLHMKSKRISNRDLRELLALFHRYKINMKQLAIFLNSKNKQWFFDNPKGYWHKKVFGL